MVRSLRCDLSAVMRTSERTKVLQYDRTYVGKSASEEFSELKN